MSPAAVFDSAGTLMKTVRCVFAAETQTLIRGAETTLLVFEDSDRSLVLLNAGSAELCIDDTEMTVSSWIEKYSVSFAVSCGNATHDTAAEILQNDTGAKLQYLQTAASACRTEAEQESSRFAMNTGLILNTRTKKVEYFVAAAGYPFPGGKALMQSLQDAGVVVCIASGDRQEKLETAAAYLGIPKSCVFGAATPEKKAEIVRHLQKTAGPVIMIGDGINDILAFHQADCAVLTVQQSGKRPDILFSAADFVISDIREAEEIVRRFL